MMPVDRRTTLLSVFAMRDARQIVKANLKKRNAKPSHYAQAEISRMALQYCNAGHWQELREQALAQIMGDARLRAEYDREGLKYEAQMAKRNRPLCVLPRMA
jgi:hypothetical protein